MKQAIQFTNTVTNIALTSLIVNVLLGIACFVFFVRLNEVTVAKVTCASFSSYGEALEAYNAGNKALDHNHNGVPCETLLK